MKRLRNVWVVLTIAALVGTVAGCATTQQQTSSPFLGEYPAFTKGADEVDLRYLKAGVDFKKYKKVMMDEVVFFLSPDSESKAIVPSEIKALSEEFHKIFIETLGDIFTDKPGPDVVRMRLAVTDIKRSNPVAGTMTTVIPVGLAVSLVKRGATGEYTGIGSANAEVEFLDSLTNQRIAAAVDKAPGGKLDVGELSPVKSAFKYWAKRLQNFMTGLKDS